MPDSVGLAWYRTGTVTVTQGSTAVTGVNTNWVAGGIKVGDIFTIDRSVIYEVANVNSATSITLSQAYAGSSGSSQNYMIIKNFAATTTAELAAYVSKLVEKYETYIDADLKTITGPAFDFASLYRSTWAASRSYKALDIVMYNGAFYVATVAHTSSSSNAPGTSGGSSYWLSYAPAQPSGVEIFNYNNSGLHNSIFRGASLGSSFTAAQQNAVNDGSFSGLWVGDFWTFNNVSYSYVDENNEAKTATYSGTMRIADLNYLLRSGDSVDLRTNHIIVVPDSTLFTATMNDTNTTAGAYVGSKMRTVHLRRALAIFKACFGSSCVLPYRTYLQNAVDSGQPSGGLWTDSDGCELLTEQMAYGGLVFNSGASNGSTVRSRHTIYCKQLNLFRLRPDFISNRVNYWLQDVVSGAAFASVNYSGYATCTYAAAEWPGVRPACAIRKAA